MPQRLAARGACVARQRQRQRGRGAEQASQGPLPGVLGELLGEHAAARWRRSAASRRGAGRRRARGSPRRAAAPPARRPAASGRRPSASSRSATAAKPCTHGPHWPALSPASQRATRTVSATPQRALAEQREHARAGRGLRAARASRRRSSSRRSRRRRSRYRRSRRRAPPGRLRARPPAASSSERHRGAVLDLVHTGVGDRPAQRDERRAGVLRRAQRRGTSRRRGGRSARRGRTSRRCSSSVGRPPTPRSKTIGGVKVG